MPSKSLIRRLFSGCPSFAVVVVATEQDKSGTIDAIELQDVLCKLGFEASGGRGSFRMEHAAHCVCHTAST